MIEANGLTFAYGGRPLAGNALTFSVAEGEVFGFLGPSGAGKSTTQKSSSGCSEDIEGTCASWVAR